MKIILQSLVLFAYACCLAGEGTNRIAADSLGTATNLVPLRLKLPMPSLGANGPQDLPVGPHIVPPPMRPPPPFLVPEGATNLAFGRRVTASVEKPVRGKLSMVTDGAKEAFEEQLVELAGGVQWVQVDLERECSIYAVVVWHDAVFQVPLFRGVVVQAADDAEFTKNVRTLFNNDYENSAGLGAGTDKEYFETRFGKLIDARGIKARYLRFYSNGSTNGPLNGYAEVEAWGIPAIP